MITLEIDDETMTVAPGTTILEAVPNPTPALWFDEEAAMKPALA